MPAVVGDVLGDILSKVKTPEVKQLASAGKIEEAAGIASPDEEVKVLLQSQRTEHWDRARTLLARPENQVAQYFLTLAYLYWESGDLDAAIGVAEAGLRVAERDGKDRWKLENSLAYYYADRGNPKDETKAKNLVASAKYSCGENGRHVVDTEGYVSIRFGDTKEEVLGGVALCGLAHNQGVEAAHFAKTHCESTRQAQETGASRGSSARHRLKSLDQIDIPGFGSPGFGSTICNLIIGLLMALSHELPG